jgi:hypothetical protein
LQHELSYYANIQLLTTCNKNKQQHDAKNNVELDQMDKDEYEGFRPVYQRRPQQVYQGLNRDG